MIRRMVLTLFVFAIVLAVAVACGGAAPATPEPQALNTPDSVQESVRLTVEADAVAKTVTAMIGGESVISSATAEPIIEPPAATTEVVAVVTEPPQVEPSPTTAAALPTAEQPATCTIVTGVNVRSGPGTAYQPPVGSLAANTVVTPISFVPNGFPEGPWLQVQVPANGQLVWVSAMSNFVNCTIAVTSFPGPASIPPTPRPTSTPTPIPVTATPAGVVAGLPPNVDNDIPGGACQNTVFIVTKIQENPNFLYRVYAHDSDVGDNDGDGMELVRFTISNNAGTVYQREERTAGYCIFRGGEPNCMNWPFNEQGQYTWGEDGQVVTSGTYQVFIEVESKNPDPGTGSNVCNWNFDMTVTVP